MDTLKLGVTIGATLGSGFKSVFSNANSEVKKLEAATKKAVNSIGDVYKAQTKQRHADSGGLGLGGTAGVLGAAYAFAQPIKKAIEFESVMADVRKVVDVTDGEFKTLGRAIMDMSTKIPMSANGIGAIVAAAGQSGVAKNELLGFAASAAKMGVAFDMSGQEAGQTMASWRAGMAITQKQAESLADAVNYLDANMNAGSKEISDVIRRQGAVAKAAGLNEIQIAALSAALLNSGAESDVAATALKNLTNALTKGGSATKAQEKVFDQLGLKSEKVTAQMQKDAEGTIKMVFGRLAEAPAEIRGSLVGDLFGEEAKGAIMPLLVNLKAMEEAFNSVADASKYAGSMQKEYDVRSKTTANNLQLLDSTVNRVGEAFGSALLPALNDSIGPMANVAVKVGSMLEDMPAFSHVIGVAAVGIGAYATSIGVATAAQWGLNVAMSANPIGVAIAELAAFGAMAYTVYKNWDPIVAWFSEKFTWLWKAIDKIVSVGSSIGGVFNMSANASMKPVGAIGGVLGSTGAGTGASNMPTKAGFMGPVPAKPLPTMNLSGAAREATVNNVSNATITINQQAGENGQDLAKRVSMELARAQAADKRRALHD